MLTLIFFDPCLMGRIETYLLPHVGISRGRSSQYSEGYSTEHQSSEQQRCPYQNIQETILTALSSAAMATCVIDFASWMFDTGDGFT